MSTKNTKTTPNKPQKGRVSNPLKRNTRDWDKQKVMDVVCNGIASSSRSMTTVLAAGYKGHALPDYATVARWIAEPGDNPYRDQYALAKESQAEFMAEELAELHNKAWVPAVDKQGNMIYDADGELVMTVSKASAAIVRLESDNKKWLMSKLKPKRYGDKITAEVAPSDSFTTMLYRISQSNTSAFTPVANPDEEEAA